MRPPGSKPTVPGTDQGPRLPGLPRSQRAGGSQESPFTSGAGFPACLFVTSCSVGRLSTLQSPLGAPKSKHTHSQTPDPQVSARGAGSVAEVEAGRLAALGRRPGKVGRWAYLPEVWLRLRLSLVTLGLDLQVAPELGLPTSSLVQGGPWGCRSQKRVQVRGHPRPCTHHHLPGRGPGSRRAATSAVCKPSN